MNPLYDVPKDILVKMISIVRENAEKKKEKEYSNYMLIEMYEYDSGFKQFNDELELKFYILDRISSYEKSKLDEYDALEDIVDEFEYACDVKIQIMKGKFILIF